MMGRSPYKTFIHLRHHENGQRLAGNVGNSETISAPCGTPYGS